MVYFNYRIQSGGDPMDALLGFAFEYRMFVVPALILGWGMLFMATFGAKR